MKKIYIGLFWACILGITGCYEDDSTMATPESMVNEITIEEFADTSAVAYSTVLELTPKVTGYSDTELEYRFLKLINLPLKFLLMSARKAVQCPNFRRF